MARARGGGFQADVTDPVTHKRHRPMGFKTLVAAEVWELQAQVALKLGQPLPPIPTQEEGAEWTLGEMLDWAYEVYWKVESADPSYHMKNIVVLKKDLGPNTPAVEFIGADGYNKIKAACEARGNSGETINKKASTISKALKLSIERGKLQNVIKPQYGRLPKGAGREFVLSREMEARCLEFLRIYDPEMAQWFIMGMDTGFRSYSEGLHIYPFVDVRGEDLFIRGRVLDDEAPFPNVVEIASARRRVKTGEGKSRIIGMTKRSQEIVAEWRTKLHNRRDVAMFENLNKQKITERWHTMAEALGYTGPAYKEFVPYSLRHTFGTRCILAGVNVDELRVLMGHSTRAQTEKYVHLAGLVQKGAAAKLEKFLEGDGG